MNEHPFSPYIRALGKGKTGSRALSREEARSAFGMILRGEATPVQVGAFLMLMRVKEETADELAGFVEAVHDYLAPSLSATCVDIDWPCYAGKSKQQPWYVLSALLLAEHGHRVLLHGCDSHSKQRLFTEDCFRALGLPVADNWSDIASQIDQHKLSYFPLRHWCAPLQALIGLRAELGLRSPVHTLARLINPQNAPCSLQSIFHPAYAEHHQEAAYLLKRQYSVVFKGDGGECELRPNADSKLLFTRNGEKATAHWPRTLSGRVDPVAELNPEALRALWRGDSEDSYGREAVLQTCALALSTLNAALSYEQARATAEHYWQNRNRQRLSPRTPCC